MQYLYTIGSRSFVLDQDKAEAAFAAKKVINGRKTMSFNLLPLKYQWAYDLYRTMKANHWEPEDIPMGKDIEQWRDEKVADRRSSAGSSAWASATSPPPRASSATTSSTSSANSSPPRS